MSQNNEEVCMELMSLTYGSLVTSVVKSTNNIDDANEKLKKIGENIGNCIVDSLLVSYDYDVREFQNTKKLIDTYLAKCFKFDFKSEVENDVITITVTGGDLTKYVYIPQVYKKLKYINPIIFSIKQIYAMIHYDVNISLDCKNNDNKTPDYSNFTIKIKKKGRLNTLPPGEY